LEVKPVHHRHLLLSCLLAAAAALPGVAVAAAGPSSRSSTPAIHAVAAGPATGVVRTKDRSICRHAHGARTRCFAIRVDRFRRGRVKHESSPIGYGPADLQRAYSLPDGPEQIERRAEDATPTVAVIDGYDDPNAERDLGIYRAQYGLPPCTTTGGCFRKVDQNGGHDYPQPDGGWAEETSLDLDMVSAACPQCRILLVEASTSSMANLGAAVDTAVRLGAVAVSNSYGGPDASDRDYGRYYHHPGVAITASAGDSGYGVSYPASSRWVIAVGGTTLKRAATSRGFTEAAWSDSGSGCSTLNNAAWQSQAVTGCAGRAVADLSAVADPATGVAVFDSFAYQGASGWLEFGGTSASSPIIAAIYAQAGHTDRLDGAATLWAQQGGLHDVTAGRNGSCPSNQLCIARRGWDGPTGWGTPDGLAAF
jgi:hypothetical protein